MMMTMMTMIMMMIMDAYRIIDDDNNERGLEGCHSASCDCVILDDNV